MNDHLSDETIYAYLDDALSLQARTHIEDHLSGCPACLDQMTQSSALFRALEELPEMELQRDLTPVVLEGIGNPSSRTNPQTDKLRWVFSGQMLAAMLLLILIWPTILLELPFEKLAEFRELLSLEISNGVVDFSRQLSEQLSTLQVSNERFIEALQRLPSSTRLVQLSILEALFMFFVAIILWVAGNSLLLNKRERGGGATHYTRRIP